MLTCQDASELSVFSILLQKRLQMPLWLSKSTITTNAHSQLPSDDIPDHKELIRIANAVLRQLSEEMKEHPDETLNELLELLKISTEYYFKYPKMS